MKKTLLLLSAALLCVPAFAQQITYDSLAKIIVNRSLSVKAGESVYIIGDQNTLPLMEQIIKVSNNLGAKTFPRVNPDNIEGSESMNTFLQHEFSTPEKFIDFFNKADACIILTPFNREPKWIFKNFYTETVSPERPRLVNETLVKTHVRMLYVTYPTRAFADGLYLSYDDYAAMTLQANAIDFSPLASPTARLKAMLANARQIRITSKTGSSLVVNTTGRPVIVYDGVVTEADAAAKTLYSKIDRLPGGMVEVSVQEQSANGKLVVTQGECDYEGFSNATVTFLNGKVQRIAANAGADCLSSKLARSQESPTNVLASISFGFNPELQPMTSNGGLYWPEAAAGSLTITLGGNQFLGGANSINTPQFNFTLRDATVEIDGKVAFQGR